MARDHHRHGLNRCRLWRHRRSRGYLVAPSGVVAAKLIGGITKDDLDNQIEDLVAEARRHRGVVVTRRLASWLAVAALGLSMLVFAAVDEVRRSATPTGRTRWHRILPAPSVRGSRSPRATSSSPATFGARSGSGSTRAIRCVHSRPTRRHLRRRRRLHTLRRRRHRPRVDPPSRGRSGSGHRPWSGVPSMARRRSRGDR